MNLLNRALVWGFELACIFCGSSVALSEESTDRVVVLTFDDSVRSHYTVVRPILKELGFSATFFITEGFDFLTNKRDYLTWEQIKELHDDGFEIGNHTRDHMGVNAGTLRRLQRQIDHIDQQCIAHGIPKPVSFGYPGNSFHRDALPLLAASGFKFARRGGSPEYGYGEGGGVAFAPGRDHPLLIPSVGDARPNWSLHDFKQAVKRGGDGKIPVLQFHGVPDRQHPWVHTPPERFRDYMTYLKTNGYHVIAMRDLTKWTDGKDVPNDPEKVIAERVALIQEERDRSNWPMPAGRAVKTWRSEEGGNLTAVLQDNSDSPRVLSGLQSLFHSSTPTFDAFDPDTVGASAGLNFEHIISGHANPANKFSPRHGYSPLVLDPGEEFATLFRRAENGPWDVDSTWSLKPMAPHAIDFEFACRPNNASILGDRNYAVFFFANYMNDVADPAIHFRGIQAEGAEEQWIRAEAPQGQHVDYRGGGTYRGINAAPLAYDVDHDFKLNLWSYEYPRYTAPFYYGRAANGMVMMLMFESPDSADEEIRFSLFKFKLDRHPRPAWDFQYVVRNVEAGRRYGFRGRLIWKPFVSEEDCWETYRAWQAASTDSSRAQAPNKD